jgi:hypothetical protein
MGFFSAIIGTLGGLCAVVGILDAADVMPSSIGTTAMNWSFWFMLGGVLLLGSIALSVGRGQGGE